MLLSDLLHRRVVDEHGRQLGVVEDVHAVQDGPVVEGFGALLRIESLAIGRAGALGTRLGTARDRVRGPWPIVALLRWLGRRGHVVAWSQVEVPDDDGPLVARGGLRPTS